MSVEVRSTGGTSVSTTTSEGISVSITSGSSSVSVTSPAVNAVVVSEKGPKGDTGVTGSTGVTGATGATGAAGADGPVYSVSCVDGDNSDEEKIRLTGSDSSTDDVVLEVGTGLSIARSSDKITFTNTVSNTQLSTEQVQDIAGPLVATGGTKTNIAVTYDDASGNMDFVVASDLNTTGNAGTATALATARAINGVDFDGTGAITVTAAGSTLSDTVTVAKGGTGLTTVAANTILTGNGASALTSEAYLTFGAARLTIGDAADIQPYLRMINDENTLEFGIANGTNDFVTGSADGDVVLNSFGDHNVIIGQNDLPALTIDTNGDSNFNRRFTVTGDTDGTYEGDVVYFGGTTSMTVGTIYHYKSDGTWEVANANAVATCDGLLGVALGAASDTNGMLLRGMVTLDHDSGAVGDVLYLSNTAGDASSTAPSDNNDIVRVIGYCLHASNGQIWFNPDGTYVEVTA